MSPQLVPDNPGLIAEDRKKWLLEELLDIAYSFEPNLSNASAEYQDHARNTCLINTEGNVIKQMQAWIGLRLNITIEIEGKTVQSHASRYVKDQFGLLAFGVLNDLVLEAIRTARHVHAAQPVHSGSMPVLFGGAAPTMLCKSPLCGYMNAWGTC